MNRKITFIWIGMIIVVTIGSLIPSNSHSSISNLDKILHFIAYLAVAFVPACFSYKRSFIIKSQILLFFIGGTIEIFQYYIPGRSMDYIDLLANTVGILLGWGIGVVVKRFVMK